MYYSLWHLGELCKALEAEFKDQLRLGQAPLIGQTGLECVHSRVRFS